MALPANALITLKELKDYLSTQGPAKDSELERFIGRASSEIEGEGVRYRRLVYRGPIEDDDNIMAVAALANGSSSPALAGQPNSAGRTLVIKRVDADRGLTAGTLTVTGTVGGVPGTTEVFDLTAGDEMHGLKFFTAISGLALEGVSGSGAGDTLQIGTSPGYTELYTPCGNEISPLEWPIRSVVQVHEDYSRVFGVDTLLVAGTDYEVRNEWSARRSIARLGSGYDSSWAGGRRVVRARLSAGYRGTAEVPEKIKGVCKELAAWHYQHANRKEYGLQSMSDALGGRSFIGPPVLTTGMRSELSEFARVEMEPTAERAWTEAA